jgi:molybdate transport system substrate-binding protein
MNKSLLCAMMATMVPAGFLCGAEKGAATPAAEAAPLRILVGGTMRPAMEELIRQYTAKTGQKIEMDNGDSGELMIRIEQTKSGDAYVCHDPFLATLERKGFRDRAWTVASLKPVIVVPKGNPRGIAGFGDLAKPGTRLVLTDSTYSTMGHIVSRMAGKAGLAARIESNTVTRTRGGGQAANAVALGTADASIVWDAVAFLRKDKLDAVPVGADFSMRKDVDAVTSATYGRIDMDYVRVTVATLKFSKNLDAARRFAEFVASKDARKVWDAQGYSPVDDSREQAVLAEPAAKGREAAPPRPEGSILVHCAAGMRLPVTQMAEAFEKETGVKVQLSFDGSNRLLGQVKLTRKGDVYIAGDAEYVAMAAKEGLVASRGNICRFRPVIMVQKGNPRGLRALADLARPGIKVGQGDPKAAAVGRIMPKLLELNAVDADAWRRNVVLETATVNDLAVAIKLGTLDAVVVWDAIANAYRDSSDAIAIPEDRNICPEVESAVLAFAANKTGAQAFVDFMASEKGMEICRKNGYSVDKPAPKRDNQAP